MKRKILIIFLLLVCALCLAFGLTACDLLSDTDTTPSTDQTDETETPDDGGSTGDNEDPDGGESHTHSLVKTENVAATCEANGNIEYWYCSGCDKYFSDETGTTEITSDETVIAAKNHSLSNIAATAATCGANGNIEYWYCSDCGKYFSDAAGTNEITLASTVIAATGLHTYGDDGKCTTCGALKTSEGLSYFSSTSNMGETIYSVDGIGTCTDTDIAIPSTYNGYAVISITAGAFSSCTSLTSVTITDGVTSIGSSAFSGCTLLESIILSDSVTYISKEAFYDCTSLTNITIGNSLTFVGKDAFYNTAYYNDTNNWEDKVLYMGNCLVVANTSISGEYSIKEGITTIGSYAFYNCASLTSITIPNSISVIDSYAFKDCTKLATIIIPENLDIDISNYVFDNTAFYNTTSNWEDDVLYLGNYLIKAKTSINGEYTIKDGTTIIAIGAFHYCSSLTSVIIPESITIISDNTFRNCTSLTSITIPNSVTSIGNHAFDNCTSLTSIAIPNSVTSIGEYAFYNCTSLTSVTIPDGVTSIGDYMFYNCKTLTSIIIPDSVTSISDRAFYYCSSLESIIIPDSVTSIGNYAFDGCASLTSITIPNSVTYIGKYAFDGCSATIIWGDNPAITELSNYVFSGYSGSTITIPDNVTSIGSGAFRDCTALIEVSENNANYKTIDGNLYSYDGTVLIVYAAWKSDTSFIIPDSVTTIGDWTFYHCPSLTDVYYSGTASQWASISFGNGTANPLCYAENLYLNEILATDITIEGITAISSYAFSGCTSLKSVTIGDSVTSIGDYAFDDCTALESVTIGDGVVSIGDYAFYECTALTSVIIPKSVTSIGFGAFYGCSALESVTIGDGVTFIDYYAFYGCTSLTSVVIPNSVTSIEYCAFVDCTSLTSIYYKGTVDEWNSINGLWGSYITEYGATIYYYSESEPDYTDGYSY